VNFFAFSVDSKSASKYGYDTHMDFCSLFANCEAKRGQNGFKKTKNTFLNVYKNFILHPFPAWEAPFCKKGQIVVPCSAVSCSPYSASTFDSIIKTT
jgi:hypothetical protein